MNPPNKKFVKFVSLMWMLYGASKEVCFANADALWSLKRSLLLKFVSLMWTLYGASKALVLRGAACTINDLFDRDIDRKVEYVFSYMVPERLLSDQVERTRLRPLASGLLTPFQGIQFLGLQLLLLLGILLQLNNYSWRHNKKAPEAKAHMKAASKTHVG
ncbi:hypothetical protein YC2023_042669 [Brassica napus]